MLVVEHVTLKHKLATWVQLCQQNKHDGFDSFIHAGHTLLKSIVFFLGKNNHYHIILNQVDLTEPINYLSLPTLPACFLDEGNQLSLHIDGDIILGGLFPVHLRSTKTENACGELDLLPGYQYLASMLFSLNEINKDQHILPGIKLGTKIYDTCRSQTIGSDGAEEIIKYTLREDNDTAPLSGVVGPF